MARKTTLRFLMLALVVALSVGAAPGVALGQTAAMSFKDTTVQVQIWPEADQQNTLVIVGATLPTDTVLPVTIELPLPAGAQVQWAGEIEGTNPDLDVQRTHEIVQGEGGSAVRFTVEQFTSFQYEAFLPAATGDGGRRSFTLDWIQTVPSLDLSVAWKFPAGVSDLSLEPATPGDPITNSAGESLYTLVSVTPAPGDTMKFSASYATEGAVEEPSSGITAIQVVIGLLVVAVVALVVVVARQRQAAQVDE